MTDADKRERDWNLIRGGVMAMWIDNATKMRLFRRIDAVTECCPECDVIMVPEAMVCRECGPTP